MKIKLDRVQVLRDWNKTNNQDCLKEAIDRLCDLPNDKAWDLIELGILSGMRHAWTDEMMKVYYELNPQGEKHVSD